MKRVQVGIKHDDLQPDHAALKSADIATRFPTDCVRDRITDMADRVVESVAGKRISLLVLELDTETACSGCGEINDKAIAAKFQQTNQ